MSKSKNEPAAAPLATKLPAAPKAAETQKPSITTSPGPRPVLMAAHSPRAVRGGEMGV